MVANIIEGLFSIVVLGFFISFLRVPIIRALREIRGLALEIRDDFIEGDEDETEKKTRKTKKAVEVKPVEAPVHPSLEDLMRRGASGPEIDAAILRESRRDQDARKGRKRERE